MDSSVTSNLKSVFREYDQNGDGTISEMELRRVLFEIGGDELTEQEIEQIFTAMDSNADGRVQYEEFVDWVNDETVAFTDLCSPTLPSSGVTNKAKMQSALRKGLRAALKDDAPISGLNDLSLSFTGEEHDLYDVTNQLRILDVKALRQAYEEADLDRNGFLQLEELRQLLFPNGFFAGSEESSSLVKAFAQMDKNNDGKVRCGEFVSYLLATKKCLSSVPSDADKKDIAEAFAKSDTNKDGRISTTELEALLGAAQMRNER